MYDADGDLGHYYRFEQLKYDRAYLAADEVGRPSGPPLGVDYSTVHPMVANPHGDDYSDPELRAASDAVNRTWSGLLRDIEAGFNGRPEALLTAVPAMFRLRDQALVLLANPLPADTPAGREGRHAGPTFEWLAEEGDSQ
jgi:hypothetical protein